MYRSWLTSWAMRPMGKRGARSSGPMGCCVPGMDDRRHGFGEVGLDVVPVPGHILFVQENLHGIHGSSFCLIRLVNRFVVISVLDSDLLWSRSLYSSKKKVGSR